ncbi:hypothetical protein G7Y79_00021g050780 [Physcia stellaris]|nr:hypothetical protein G7Y79_00021g050780 [Physcia stellaris]
MAEALSGMTGVLQGSIGGLLNKGQGILDRFFPPERRNELSAKLSKFATEKPMFASFILSQVALSSLPLGLFIILTITVIVFALIAALLIGVLGAVIFIVVCVGIGLIILLPTLFVTTFAAAFIWLWGVGAYFIVKWFNQKEIPGIHKPFEEGMNGMGLDALTGSGKPPGDPSGKEANGKPKGGQANGAPPKKNPPRKIPGVDEVGKATGIDISDPKKAADVGKVLGKTQDVGKAKDLIGGAAGGVKGSVPGGLL